MTDTWAQLLAVLMLAGLLAFAMVQPKGLPEAVFAVPAAGLLVAVGVVGPEAASRQVVALAPTVGFLAAVLVLAQLADAAGVFTWVGARLARGSVGHPGRLLGRVFLAGSATTATLSLDATVVLLTPVVFATAARVRARPKPHVYACIHLANSASLLLPVSNLTNLLAFSASGLTFLQFAGLMAAPWLLVIGIEYLVFRRFFRSDLGGRPHGAEVVEGAGQPAPRFALAVLALTLLGFGVSGLVGVEPVWVAVAGAVTLAGPELAGRRIGVPALVRAASPPFCLFVFALGVVVAAVSGGSLGAAVTSVLPTTPTLPNLLLAAAIAAVLANLVNNVPATLMLVTALAGHAHPGLVLAVLVGVNIGPNLTYTGSLATLLWRRVLVRRDATPAQTEFLRLGAITVPLCLVVAVVAVWLGLTLGRGWLL
ncbi:arsenical pump membrane protein [Pseudonocardia eucalypti]|nr:arsenical pump membrane protein [Pseudonocardia eucalypti]